MAAATILDTTAWQARAVELATRHHTIGTARWLEDDEVFIVPAASRVEPYRVRVTNRGATFACECVAGQRHRPCKHAGAAIHASQQREAAMAEARRSEQTWYAQWLAVEYPAY